MSLNGYSLESTDRALAALAGHAYLVRCAVGDVSFRRWLIDLCGAEGMFFSHKPLDEIGQVIEPAPVGAQLTYNPDNPPKSGHLRVAVSNPRVPPPRLPFAQSPDDDPPAPRAA